MDELNAAMAKNQVDGGGQYSAPGGALRYAGASWPLLYDIYNRSLLPYNRSLLPYDRSLLTLTHTSGMPVLVGLLYMIYILGLFCLIIGLFCLIIGLF